MNMNNRPQQYADKSAKELRHSVIEGDLDLGQFTILKKDQITSGEPQFKITGRIIGASHLFSFDFDSRVFHELFACQEIDSAKNEVASYGPLERVTASIQLQLWNRIDYSFQAKLLRSSEGEQWLMELEQHAADISQYGEQDSIGLVYDFPKSDSNPIVPKTIVVANYNQPKAQIKITTAHSYPNEKTIVRSDSILQLV